LELRIADDGVGFDVTAKHPGHFGLVGLRELAQLIGAELEILSTPGEGTVLRLALRMTPEMLWPPYRPRLRYI
jgi:signal transduction histidine kinase